MRFKQFSLVPSIIKNFVPPREDRVIAIIKSPICDMCGGDDTMPDFTPIIFMEETETACGAWACIGCWHELNTETLSENMMEKIDESMKGIELTNLTRNSWKYNVDIYHASALWRSKSVSA